MKRGRNNVAIARVSCDDFGPCHKYLALAMTMQDSHIAAAIQYIFRDAYKPFYDLLKQDTIFCESDFESILMTDHSSPPLVHLQFSSNQKDFINNQLWLNFLKSWMNYCNRNSDSRLIAYLSSLEDQRYLREMLHQSDGIAFVCNGSFLPLTSTKRYTSHDLENLRRNSSSKMALNSANIKKNDSIITDSHVAFCSPPSMEREFTLPNKGKVTGMLIPKGIVIIVGGGYHGKSTLLNAIKMGVYDKEPNDGCEFVVSRNRTYSIRSEEGRYVGGIDISPFISSLPALARVDPTSFRTDHASGSTSMAANLIEVLEIVSSESAEQLTQIKPQSILSDPIVLLLDEDTSANNFMVRDSRMRSLVSHEPITPYSYRVNGLFAAYDISSVIVIGGSGDWFDVQTCTILMDNYQAQDVTKRANSISRSFCNGRVQYNGRGLVHQLPWPSTSVAASSTLTNTIINDVSKVVKIERPEGPTRPRYVDLKSLMTLFGIYKIDVEDNDILLKNNRSNYIMSLNNVGDSPPISNLYCMVKSVSWSSDFQRIHFHIDFSPATCTNSNDSQSIPSIDYLRDVLIDISACDQIIPSKESAIFIAYSILFCSLYVVAVRVKIKQHEDSVNNDFNDSQESFISVSEFLSVYRKFIKSIIMNKFDERIVSAECRAADENDNYETLISKFIHERLLEKNGNQDDNQALLLSEIFHQREANFLITLFRIRGLKFSYLN